MSRYLIGLIALACAGCSIGDRELTCKIGDEVVFSATGRWIQSDAGYFDGGSGSSYKPAAAERCWIMPPRLPVDEEGV